MIKFFRHIRKSLLSEDKTGKYLKYALGEIVLVMIGILLALQVNNWNQNRLNQNLEFQYYERLLDDVREERLILEATFNYSKQVTKHAKNAIAVFENSVDANPDPVANLIDMYQASQWIDPYSASSTYKELIASGQINLIQNDSLKTALIRYYDINWSESGVAKLENTYRKNLRGKMPDDIQSKIRLVCGDTYVKTRNSYLPKLPDDCSIDLDYVLAKSVVEELSQDESLINDLRYLIGNEAGKLNDLTATKIQLESLIVILKNINND
ncbi:hypothetical protein C1T31_12670 [Hanstruepera neustonica]|uniref:Uncharacterized protein n=1 Tax=Hanstruepera neustonica TaxID=1445657 RepID=A0A2K1DVW8_9FLAO|nr:DUF6090 family protein [Hanstruepera neustonica]PNQ72174.1 hypothetical protein C1T31_12670 [Hanstruepera neustonica]